MASNSSFCLFLGDLSLFCTEKDILAAFSSFGRVTNVRIKRSSENKKHLLYGFVEYASASEAVQAMQSMNNSLLLGRVLRVRWASNKQGKKMKPDDAPQCHGPSVFVVFLVYNKQKVVNELVLRSVFEAFGSVDDVVVKQSKIDTMTGQQKGYAFVQYSADWAGINAASAAVANLDNFIVDGVGYKCEVSYNTEELRRQLSGSSTPSGMSPMAAMAPQAAPMHPLPAQPAVPYAKSAPPTAHMVHMPTVYKMDTDVAWGAAPTYAQGLYHPSPLLIPPNPSMGMGMGMPMNMGMGMGMGIPYYFDGPPGMYSSGSGSDGSPRYHGGSYRA